MAYSGEAIDTARQDFLGAGAIDDLGIPDPRLEGGRVGLRGPGVARLDLRGAQPLSPQPVESGGAFEESGPEGFPKPASISS